MGKKIVLIVEDDVDLRELLAEKLSSLGYDVHQAGDGEEGLGLVKKVVPDVVVSDVLMPKKDGNKFLKELRQTDLGKNLPFIVLTARVAMRDYFEVMDVDGFLEKPLKVQDLVNMIEASIQKRAVQKELKRPDSVNKEHAKEQGLTSKDEIVIIQEATKTRTVFDGPSLEKGAEGPAGVNRKQSVKSKYHSGKKILILENNMDAFYELQRIFSEMGNTVQLVATPQECIEEANATEHELIILRDIFNKIDAEELASRLKAIPHLRRTPIIIYNNLGQMTDTVNAQKLKGRSFVLSLEGKEMIKKAIEILEI